MRLINRSVEILRDEGLLSFIYSATQYISNRQIPKIWYGLGSGRICSICGWEGSRFLSFGVEQRPDSACPKCGSKERHRLIWEYLTNEYSFDNNIDILYFAPIDGLEDNLRHKDSVTVTTTDLMQRGVDFRANIANLSVDDNSFDIIICSHVLEHVLDHNLALNELHRVLRTDGEALVLLPQDRERKETYEDPTITSVEGRKEAFGQGDHVRWYGRDVEKIINSTGFEVTTVDYVEKFDESYINKHRLRESDEWIHSPTRIFRCVKSEG